MLSEAEMATVKAKRHEMAEVMQKEGISLFGPPPSPKLQKFIDRINAGKGFTTQELARMDEIGRSVVGEDNNTQEAA